MEQASLHGFIGVQLRGSILHEQHEFRIPIKDFNALHDVTEICLITLPINNDLMPFEGRSARKLFIYNFIQLICSLERQPKLFSDLRYRAILSALDR